MINYTMVQVVWRDLELFVSFSKEFCKSRSTQKKFIILYHDFSMDLAYLCNRTLWYAIHIYDKYGLVHKFYSILVGVERITTQSSYPSSIDEVMIKLKMKHI